MTTPSATYARRMAALPGAMRILALHPEGLPLRQLADELGTSVTDLREAFLAYYRADLVDLGSWRLPVIEFVSGSDDPDDAATDPATAERVRVVSSEPHRELGVDHLSASELGRLYQAGSDLLALEPENAVLRSALERLHEALWAGEGPSGAEWGADTARDLYQAIEGRRRVRIRYARQWRPGTRERVIEPYRLTRTRRGWEVDAGPPDERAAVRTYLVSGILTAEVLDETFQPPPDAAALVAANRQPTAVDVVVPQESRWAAERYAEAVEVLADDETDVSLRLALLPPVADRLGLLLLVCGPEAFVVAPAALADAGTNLAARLLAHHQGGPAAGPPVG